MLSYRHSYHAGNFADVLKHICLIETLDYLTRKEKPLCYLDTHSGCSAYDLESPQALKTQEYEGGIGKLWSQGNLPDTVARYVELIGQFNDSTELKSYPGSPWLAQQRLREYDRLFLCELHAKEHALLRQNMRGDRRVKVRHEDGLQALVSLMPPKEKRGLVLIDPSYEIKSDYQAVVKAVKAAYKRFSTGTYAIWYPVVERQRIDEMEQSLQTSGIRNIQLFELGIEQDEKAGMTSSGMIVINPPWTLMASMKEILSDLTQLLARQEKGFFRAETLVAE